MLKLRQLITRNSIRSTLTNSHKELKMSAKEYTGVEDVLAKIQSYSDDFRPVAEQMHRIIMDSGGEVYPRLWYGMPGYAKTKTGPVLVYFRKDKYVTFGRTESSRIEFDKGGNPVPTAWFFEDLNDASTTLIKDIAQLS